MKDFVEPEIENIEDPSEGIFIGSGAIFDNPEEDEPILGGCWINWQCKWVGHNNGGHSVCNVTATHCGDHSGNRLTMNFMTNFPIAEVKNASGLTISNVSTYSFTLTRNNFFNPTESIGFNFEIVTSALMYDENGNALHGAIGENNGAGYYCKLAGYSCG